MKRILFLLALTVLSSGTLWLRAQSPGQTRPSQAELEAARAQQAARDAADQRARQERETQQRVFREAIWGTPAAAAREAAIRDAVQDDYASPVMQHHSDFDLASIPIRDWLAAKEISELPWKVQVRDPILRMDQRLEVTYTATVRAKDLNRLGTAHELMLIGGIAALDGEWLTAPKVVRHKLDKQLPDSVDVRFADSVFLRPGEYVLWLVLYDAKTAKHSTVKREVEVSEIEDDPLPDIGGRLPMVEFPRRSDPVQGPTLEFSAPLFLPVLNKRPVAVDVISALSPPEQWSGRRSVSRSHTNDTLSTLSTLTQMELADGSLSLAGLDLIRREVVFDQQNLVKLDWTRLALAVKEADSVTISADALENRKNYGAFFREFLGDKLAPGSAGPIRVFIVVSSSLLFERGSDLTPLQFEGDCHCRIYHVRFRHNLNDVFDDLQKLIKPLRPKTFNVRTAQDLRKAIAQIIGELESL